MCKCIKYMYVCMCRWHYRVIGGCDGSLGVELVHGPQRHEAEDQSAYLALALVLPNRIQTPARVHRPYTHGSFLNHLFLRGENSKGLG